MQPQDIVLLVTVLALSISVHESSHAYVAARCGDRTAKRKGRISLNPLDHIDPIGTVLVPALLIMMNSVPFGWARPVPVNPGNLNRPRRDRALVSAAGPASNIALALGSIIICALFAPLLNERAIPLGKGIGKLLLFNTSVNILLGIFNLIPIGPLDGSGILEYFLPRQSVRWLRQNQMVVTIVLFMVIFSGGLNFILGPFQAFATRTQWTLIRLLWGPEVAAQVLQLTVA